MASPITYKRLVLSGDKAKETADEVKTKMSKDWKKDFPDGSLDIKSGVEGKMVIDVKTKESSAASLASKIKDIATRNKVDVVTKDKPTLKAVKENQDDLMSKIKKSLTYQVTGGKKGEPMSKGQTLPANTKMKKSELKEIVKNFNKETKNSLKESTTNKFEEYADYVYSKIDEGIVSRLTRGAIMRTLQEMRNEAENIERLFKENPF